MGSSSATPTPQAVKAAGATGTPGQAKPFFQWMNDATRQPGTLAQPSAMPMTPAGSLGVSGGPNPMTSSELAPGFTGGPEAAPGMGISGGPNPMTTASSPQPMPMQNRRWLQGGAGGAGTASKLPFYG